MLIKGDGVLCMCLSTWPKVLPNKTIEVCERQTVRENPQRAFRLTYVSVSKADRVSRRIRRLLALSPPRLFRRASARSSQVSGCGAAQRYLRATIVDCFRSFPLGLSQPVFAVLVSRARDLYRPATRVLLTEMSRERGPRA